MGLLVLDCGEDVRQGLALLQEIKPAYPNLPVLFLAESGSEERVTSAFRLGARDFIRRPFGVLDLKSRIETFLRLKRQRGEDRRFVSPDEVPLSVLGEVEEGDYIPLNIIRSIKCMEDNLADHAGLDDLAREAVLSRYQFCRTFAETMKMSPMKFLNYLRVQRVKQLPGRNGLNLSAVATRVGFGNVNNMN